MPIGLQAIVPAVDLFDHCLGEGPRNMAHKFEIYKDKAGEFRVRFRYNAEILFSTEGYSSKASAKNAIDSIKKNGPEAPIEDNS
ncbi:hypothetical protein RLDS_24585 [Sphingobium lactosutens DS20]|uniref:DUF1508 domain-containing protein n=3 Tax=Sphingobium TaxID=165695 RepID=T0HG19_9SPHN|nr:hypothetical protein RLDS_24585 [Sphingobium lactosutens DS20]